MGRIDFWFLVGEGGEINIWWGVYWVGNFSRWGEEEISNFQRVGGLLHPYPHPMEGQNWCVISYEKLTKEIHTS